MADIIVLAIFCIKFHASFNFLYYVRSNFLLDFSSFLDISNLLLRASVCLLIFHICLPYIQIPINTHQPHLPSAAPILLVVPAVLWWSPKHWLPNSWLSISCLPNSYLLYTCLPNSWLPNFRLSSSCLPHSRLPNFCLPNCWIDSFLLFNSSIFKSCLPIHYSLFSVSPIHYSLVSVSPIPDSPIPDSQIPVPSIHDFSALGPPSHGS